MVGRDYGWAGLWDYGWAGLWHLPFVLLESLGFENRFDVLVRAEGVKFPWLDEWSCPSQSRS